MDVSGVGFSPAGFPAATPEAVLDPQRSGSASTVRENPGQAQQAPLDLLSDERLGRELLSLGLRPDSAKLLAARALVLQQGSIDLTLLLDVERSLETVDKPGMPEAEAAAFLLARGLPANQDSMSWVLGRQYSPDSAGSRMIAIIQRFAAATAARNEAQGNPTTGEGPSVAMPRPNADSQAKPSPASGTGASTGPAAAKATPPATAVAAPSPAVPTPAVPSTSPSGATSTPSTASVPPETAAPEASATPREGAATTGPETSPAGAKTAPAEAPKAPVSGEKPATRPAAPATPAATAPATPAATAPSPTNSTTAQAQPAAVAQAQLAAEASEPSDLATAPELPASKTADVSEAKSANVSEAKSAAKTAEPVERALLSKLQALALPEGKAKDVEATLRRLVQALRPQEADLARGEVVEAKERLSSLAAKTIEKTPQDANARAVHDEIRFQQVNSARHEGQTPHELVIPLWWNGGTGEIRVQERPKGAAQHSEEDSAPTRVVIALDTPHLGAVRIDLLLAQRQVNCLVAAQDQGAADFLSPRLTELRSAIEDTGIRVQVMGMKSFSTDEGHPSPGDAKGVDYYW